MDRDDETHFYTLPLGLRHHKHSGVRKTDIMKNYFVDRYGAIKSIDLSPSS